MNNSRSGASNRDEFEPQAVFSALTRDSVCRWAVILAGGDGERLLPLTRHLTGDDRPKQYCRLVGDQTLLEQTRRRTARIARTCQTLVVTNESHEPYFRDLVGGVPEHCLLKQPANRGTVAAIAYSLMRLRELNPFATVAIFPSDHHFENDDNLASQVELAFLAVEARPELVSLLGVAPDAAETGYGWVEPGLPFFGSLAGRVWEVRRFWEKPSPMLAAALMRDGCFWNSFIMVGRVRTFMDLLRRTVPRLLDRFESIHREILGPGESDAMRAIYPSLSSTGFAEDVLSVSPRSLSVVGCSNLGWRDLALPDAVFSVMDATGNRRQSFNSADRASAGLSFQGRPASATS